MSAHEHDCAIHDFLERHAPDQFEAFWEVVGRALHAMLPALERRARRYGSAVDADEVGGQAVERALIYLRSQYRGDDVPFRFARSYGLSLQAWVLRILRLVALEQIRKGKRNPCAPAGAGDDLKGVESVAATDTVECETEALKKALNRRGPRRYAHAPSETRRMGPLRHSQRGPPGWCRDHPPRLECTAPVGRDPEDEAACRCNLAERGRALRYDFLRPRSGCCSM